MMFEILCVVSHAAHARRAREGREPPAPLKGR
jgi:AhpD family alkylhydroperoxidase